MRSKPTVESHQALSAVRQSHCTGMQLPVPQLLRPNLPEHTHVLQEESIHTNLVQFHDHPERIFHLLIIDDGVDGNVNLGAKLVGILAEQANIIQRIACGCTGAEAWSANIHGISAMVDGCDATLQILGRSKSSSFLILSFLSLIDECIDNYLLDIVDIVRRLLIYVVVDPVAIEEVGMGAPCHQRFLSWVIVEIIILRQFHVVALAHVSLILLVQGVRGILQMSRHEEFPATTSHHDAHSALRRLGDDVESWHFLDVLTSHLGMAAVWHIEDVVEATEDRERRSSGFWWKMPNIFLSR